MIGPNTPGTGGHGGGPPQQGAPPNEINALRRRAREVFEHQPQQIAISINGHVIATQKLGAEVNEQTLRLNVNEPIGFIEVFSEQDVRLLFLNVALPPQGAHQQEARVELSDGRALEAALSFSSLWPALRVVYTNPLLQTASASSKAEMEEEAAIAPLEEDRGAPLSTRLARWFASLGRHLVPPPMRLSLWAVTVLIAASLIATFALLRMRPPGVSAAELLRRSAAVDAAAASRTEVVLHRQLTLEERRAPGGELLTRRRIETWQSAGQKIKARRVYNDEPVAPGIAAGLGAQRFGRTFFSGSDPRARTGGASEMARDDRRTRSGLSARGPAAAPGIAADLLSRPDSLRD